MAGMIKAVIDTGSAAMRAELYEKLGFGKLDDVREGFTFVAYDQEAKTIAIIDPLGARDLAKNHGWKRYIRIEEFYKDMGL